MKANFALSLTEDGVRLFQRVSRGWAVVGEVAHADPEASAKMAALRREALAREPSGLRTKLLIPNEQIKYISLLNPIATTTEIDAALQGGQLGVDRQLTSPHGCGLGQDSCSVACPR